MEIDSNLLFTIFQKKGWVTKNINIITKQITKKVVIIFGMDDSLAEYIQTIYRSWGTPGVLTKTDEYFKIECLVPPEYLKKFESYGSLSKRSNNNIFAVGPVR